MAHEMRSLLKVFLLLGGIFCFIYPGILWAGPMNLEQDPRYLVPAPFNGTLGFGQILMISLPARTDRRDAMTLAFQVSGITGAEHIAGVKGEEVDAVAMPQRSTQLQPGEIGCWRSHVNAWKRIVEARWETALVIEDDVDWHIDIGTQLQSMSRALKNWRKSINDVTADHPYGREWDLFMFGHCLEGRFNKSEESYYVYPDPTVDDMNRTKTDNEILGDFDVPDGHRVLSRANRPICTMGYALTHKGAQRLLYRLGLSQLTAPLDVEFANACGEGVIECLEINPPLIGVYREVGPRSKESDIKPREGMYDKTFNRMGDKSAKSNFKFKFGPEEFEEE